MRASTKGEKMIKKYTTKSGETRYMLQTYLGIDPLTGKQRRTTRRGFKTAKEARKAETLLQIQVEEHGLEDQIKPSYTFQAIAEMWLENYQTTVKPTTFQNVYSLYSSISSRYFQKMKIEDISVAYCQKVAIELSKKYAKYSLYLSVINRIFKFAVMMDVIERNPLDRIVKPKQEPKDKPDNFYTKEELGKFLACCQNNKSPGLYIFFWLLAYTGLRRGEALALKWSDIDLDAGLLYVNRTFVRLNGKRSFQTPKTTASERVISIDYMTVEKLKCWKHQQKKMYFSRGKKYFGDENFIFTDRRCHWFKATYPENNLKSIIKKHNLKPITIHGFRHTHASLLYEAGIEPKIISDRLGHSNIKITLDLYTHINQRQRVALVEKFIDFMIAK